MLGALSSAAKLRGSRWGWNPHSVRTHFIAITANTCGSQGRGGGGVVCDGVCVGEWSKKKTEHKSVRELTWIYSTLTGKHPLCTASKLCLKPHSNALWLADTDDWLCLCFDLLARRCFSSAFSRWLFHSEPYYLLIWLRERIHAFMRHVPMEPDVILS